MESTPRSRHDIATSRAASVIVLNYNGRDLLPACLAPTLVQAEHIGAEVIVVDNGSSDGSVELLQRDFPTVRVIQAPRNLGFAEGNNVGVRAAESDTIVLLNNDAVPDAHWLTRLLAALDDPDVAVACSVVHDRDYAEAYALGTGSLSVIGHPVAGAMRRMDRPFYATGCSLAFKRSLCGEPFDPILFAYYEDVLFSWHARLRGFEVARALGSHVQHLGSATARRDPGRAFFLRERNRLFTLLVCYEQSTLARLVPLYIFDALVRLGEDVYRALTGRPAAQLGAPPLARKYLLLLQAVAWLVQHGPAIADRRREIQRRRTLRDGAITPLLSAKVFDDVVPSRIHTVANHLARTYCRLARIHTIESADEENARDPY